MASPVTIQVGASADDGYIYSTSFNSSNSSLTLGNYNGTIYAAFARFLNVAIPKGATITNAKIQYKSSGANTSASCNTRIYFNAEDNASAPYSNASYNKNLTTAYVDWTIGSWAAATWYDSPDIKTIIQELVNRAGWNSGNAMLLLHKNNSSSTGAYRGASTYEATGNVSGPTLYIEYTLPFVGPKVNIGGTWKSPVSMMVNIGGTWKTVVSVKVNIGGTWKDLA